MKKLLSLLFLCIISSSAVAQSEDSLYYAAHESMWKGKKDSTLNLLGHEIGHFWWHSAPTDNWNDWLNESFAEFSKLCLIGHDYGDTVLKDYICSYREITLKQCPIYNLDRNAEGSHAVFYQKGALILYDLWQQVGSKAFFLFMQSVADKHVSNNEQLIQQADLILGKHWGKWIMERLKQ